MEHAPDFNSEALPTLKEAPLGDPSRVNMAQGRPSASRKVALHALHYY